MISKSSFRMTAIALFFLLPIAQLVSAKDEARGPVVLESNVMQHLYCGFGIATNLQFPYDVELNQIIAGSPGFEALRIIQSETVPNLVTLVPQVTSGQVNMNVTINGITYPFMVHFVDDTRVIATQTYTIKGLRGRIQSSKVQDAPVLNPADIDVPNTLKIIDKARTDHVFANTLDSKSVWHTVNQTIPWNGNLIHVYDVVHFLEDDLLVMTIAWRNQTPNTAFYLNVQQYEVMIGNQRLYPDASTQITDTVFPGQMDVAHLFFQGHKIKPNQNWVVRPPLEEKEILSLR